MGGKYKLIYATKTKAKGHLYNLAMDSWFKDYAEMGSSGPGSEKEWNRDRIHELSQVFWSYELGKN